MIIELENTFEDVDLSLNDICRVGIEAICQSVARGEHYLLASRSLTIRLAEDEALSRTARGVMQRLKSEYSLIAGLLKAFRYRVKVCATAVKLEKELDELRWIVPIAHIADRGIRPTVLLGENSYDGDTYVFAARHYAIASRLTVVKTKIEPRNGNGAGISQELDRIIRRGIEFCLCVTDSDRLAPACDLGVIPKACLRILRDSHAIAYHVAPQSRELENAIPRSLFAEAALKTHPDAWEALQQRVGICDDAIFDYSDLKNGTFLSDVLKLGSGSKQKNFWITEAQKVLEESDCLALERCLTPDDCKCDILPGFGEGVARAVREGLERCSHHESYRASKGAENFEDWLAIGKEVFEAGAAPDRLRM